MFFLWLDGVHKHKLIAINLAGAQSEAKHITKLIEEKFRYTPGLSYQAVVEIHPDCLAYRLCNFYHTRTFTTKDGKYCLGEGRYFNRFRI